MQPLIVPNIIHNKIVSRATMCCGETLELSSDYTHHPDIR